MSAAAPAYAEIAVAAPPWRGDHTFHYHVPDDLRGRLQPGHLVMVPFGRRLRHGVVVALGDTSPVEETRGVYDLILDPPLLDPRHVGLMRWLAARYGASLNVAFDLVTPPRLERRLYATYTPSRAPADDGGLSRGDRRLLDFIRERGEASEAEIRRSVGKTGTNRGLDRLLRGDLVDLRVRVAFPEPPAQRLAVAVTPADGGEPRAILARAPKQRELWEHLATAGGATPVREALQAVSASPGVLTSLVDRGLARIERRWSPPYLVRASPDDAHPPDPPDPPDPAARRSLLASLGHAAPGVVVLQGDEHHRWALYAAAIQAAAAAGRQALVVAPDDATASDCAASLAVRTGAAVADAARASTDAQRVALWRSLRAGDIDVLVGPRAAVFAPLTRLGVVIVDREEDQGHKNRAGPPFLPYHAPAVAAQLARLHGCALILGAETPRVSTFHAVETEHSHLVVAQSAELLRQTWRRVGRGWGMQRPAGYVDIVDARSAATAGRRGVISRALYTALRKTLEARGRAVLYVNRRGVAALTVCRDCGHVFECPNCSTGMVLHGRGAPMMVCHICNWHDPAPSRCPACAGDRLRLWGYGSETVADAVSHLLPRARVARIDSDRPAADMDADAAAFTRGAVQVLVGTQRLLGYRHALGADLLGVVQADVGLRFPDFLAPERVFVTLMRLRRLVTGGNPDACTIVQTVMPRHRALTALQTGSYLQFFRAEMEQRRAEGLPPLRPLIKAAIGDEDDQRALGEAMRARKELETVRSAGADLDLEVLGPAPAPTPRQRGRYVWQLLLLGEDAHQTLPLFHGGWHIDADPIDLT